MDHASVRTAEPPSVLTTKGLEGQETVTVSCRIARHLGEALDAAAQMYDVPKSDILRDAIQDKIVQLSSDEAIERRAEEQKAKALDTAAALRRLLHQVEVG